MPRHGKPICEVKVNGQVRWKVYVSRTRGGQRKQITKAFDSYEDAERFCAQSQLGELVERKRDTFDDWADRWLERKRDEACRPVTLDGYGTDLKRPRAAFGRDRIQEVTEQQIEGVVHTMRDDGPARRSSTKMLTTLRAVFDFAVRKGVIGFNPAKDATPMGRPSKERDACDRGLILVNAFGRPMRPQDWTRRWRKLCKATEGVRDNHTLHAARHSTVTFMRNAGAPDHIVAAWHGHDEVIMRRTYSHVHTKQMRSAGSALSFGATPEWSARDGGPHAGLPSLWRPHGSCPQQVTGAIRQGRHMGARWVTHGPRTGTSPRS